MEIKRKMNKTTNQSGFSLVELLVVVIIIAIIAAIAIPNLLASRRAANEASAVSSLRTIHSAQATYQATLGGNVNYAPDLTTLGTATVPDPNGLIDSALASGSKSGYTFNVTSPATQVYCATAVPTTPGTTGNRYFAVSQPGVIWAGPGAIACSASGVLSGASAGPIQ
jgi:prepilin-type N-terminal cleavage/methylation domain-containing protein